MESIEQFDRPREAVAAHEAGHAVVALACGIPVAWVEIRTHRPSASAKQLGFTESLEDDWVRSSPLAHKEKVLRRVLVKAGGLAGEVVAGVFRNPESLRGAMSDMAQAAAGLYELGFLASKSEPMPGAFGTALVTTAVGLVQRNRPAFQALQLRLVSESRVERPTLDLSWGPDDDAQLAKALSEVQSCLRA